MAKNAKTTEPAQQAENTNAAVQQAGVSETENGVTENAAQAAQQQENAASETAQSAETAAAETAQSAETEAAETGKGASAETPVEHAAGNAQDDDPTRLVRVKNLTKSMLRQHNTGMVIGPSEVKELANDGWLHNQLRAGLLQRA